MHIRKLTTLAPGHPKPASGLRGGYLYPHTHTETYIYSYKLITIVIF